MSDADSSEARTSGRLAREPRAIALVGLMGSGKSTVGARLASVLKRRFVDADAEIEAAAQMSVSEIFEKYGEPDFRSLERRVIARLLADGPSVIATGGGALMNANTRALIRDRTVSIWLRAEIPVLMRRVRRKSDRPLLQGKDPEATLTQLLSEREHLYEDAHVVVTSREGPHEAVVESIIEAIDGFLAGESAEAEART